MTTVTLPSPASASEQLLLPPTADGRVRFTRAAYRRMYEAGLFGPEPRVELVDGEILMMSPIGPMQGALVRRLTRFFTKNLPDSIECSVQLPIIAGNHSEPEPDIALGRRRDDDYQDEHPSSEDVVLLIEVAQSSLAYDLGRKLQIYAACGIPEYWVVDVARKLVLVHRDPARSAYGNIQPFGPDGAIAPAVVPDCRLDLAWLFR